MKTNEALDGLAYLRTYGWAKGSFGESGVDGPACLQGLWTRKRVISKSTFRLIEEIIQEQYPERRKGTVLGFNDHQATTFAKMSNECWKKRRQDLMRMSLDLGRL